MAGKRNLTLALVAFGVYIVGGIGCFGGLALVFLMKGSDLWGWGDGRTIGYLALCVGICLSIMGVLLMRVFRNRSLG
ncbi:hypothetical protein [Geobacter sp. SVR]|uniref:hypothetical protein n=1 Tax=Geobacter sp. SVR TaxID=2495594 RepID=UPI00143EFB28|nr:hypothetical protein [Geobacter sp. SVR]BCS53093.1 hypothetical protein GSVR_14010 [Geobacter sp. SVR]GCF84478.1 hypothetical protein GSbR_10780 [Geobacter sp. SVR]